MADPAFTAVLFKLGEFAANQIRLQLEVRKEISLLQDQLEWLQAFVHDADRRRRAGTGTINELTLVWVSQARGIAFYAEDVLDDYFDEEVAEPNGQGSRGSNGQGSRGCCKALFAKCITGFFTKAVVRVGLPNRINLIKIRLEQIEVNKEKYNISDIPSPALASSTTAIAAWRNDLENAVGFEEDVKTLKQMLDQQNQPMPTTADGEKVENGGAGNKKHPMFISIVGNSGAGKNTLAKIIRREMAAEVKVFVRCDMKPGSKPIDLIAEVYHRVASQLGPSREDTLSTDEVIRTSYIGKLRELLVEKRYLLILGGISSTTILNSFRASLPAPEHDKYTDNGSCVILILDKGNEEVAWYADKLNRDGIKRVHELTCLDQARTRQLFLWKVLSTGQYEKESSRSGNPEDQEYSRLVYRITGGYPMAIVLLAGLLRFKEKPAQWDAVLQHLDVLCQPPQQNNEGGVNPQTNQLCGRSGDEIIFWASFEDLPNDLKSCLLYLASYPSYRCQFADEVVRMWVGEGLINNTQNGKTMEEVGYDYLKELVLRCFVEVEDTKPGGGIQLVRVHNRLMGFLLPEVRESDFMEIHNKDDGPVKASARRLSVHSSDSSRQYSKKKLPKLRSFICHSIVNAHHLNDLMFLSAKIIRVISVRWFGIQELPDQIGEMIQLRYLCLDCPNLHRLPSSIARLFNLQTLDISNTKVEEIHMDFWKIKTLRHVLARNLTLPVMPAIEEEGQGDGSNFQTLHGVRPVSSEQWSAENCPLRNMTNMRSLEMHGFQHAKHDGPAFEAALGNMPLLGHLSLKGDKIPTYAFTDPSLQSIQTMVLHGKVNWTDMTTYNLQENRPNLVQLKLNFKANSGMGSLREQLEEITIIED